MKKGSIINIVCATILVFLSVALYYFSYKTSSSVYLYAGMTCTFFALILFYSKLLPDNLGSKAEEELKEFVTAEIVEIDDNDKPLALKPCSDEIRNIVKKAILIEKKYKEENDLSEFSVRVSCTPGKKSFTVNDEDINIDNINKTIDEIFAKESDRVFTEFDIYCDKACKVSIYVNGHITVDYNNNKKDTKDLAEHIKAELKKITNKSIVIGTYIVNEKKASK